MNIVKIDIVALRACGTKPLMCWAWWEAPRSLYATDKISDKMRALVGQPTLMLVFLLDTPLMAGMFWWNSRGQSSGGYGCAGTMNWNGGAN